MEESSGENWGPRIKRAVRTNNTCLLPVFPATVVEEPQDLMQSQPVAKMISSICSISIHGTGVERMEDLIKVPDEGELVFDMLHH